MACLSGSKKSMRQQTPITQNGSFSNGVKSTRETNECDSYSAATTIQVEMSTLQQINDSIVNSQMGLAGLAKTSLSSPFIT